MSEKKRKWQHWAYLNEEGQEIWGEIFPDHKIPVLSMIPGYAKLGGQAQKVYMVYIPEISLKQLHAIIKMISQRFKAPREAILKDIQDSGLPLRYSLTSGSGTNHPGLFI